MPELVISHFRLYHLSECDLGDWVSNMQQSRRLDGDVKYANVYKVVCSAVATRRVIKKSAFLPCSIFGKGD